MASTNKNRSIIAEWYSGRSVFITGGSGFMGKVLIEKLLFSCPEIKTIYILLRAKRGKTPGQRIEAMWKLPMFQRLREAQPDAIKKIIPISGDVITEGLGISDADRQLVIENASVVFNCAATLKLEATLRDAIEQNTAGTEKVVDLAKQIKNLKAFVHLSTAFCSADIDIFEEKVYDSPDNPRDVIQCARSMRAEALLKATPSIIAPHPNTYTYTKRLAETLVASEFGRMPVAIVRPAIVIPAAFEPLPGWVDTLNGPMGLLVGAGKGVIRSMHCKAENRAQVVPVDTAINGIIAIAHKIGSATFKPREVPVYNMTQDKVVHITWGEVLNKGRNVLHENPFEGQIWYPDGDMRSSRYIHWLYCFFFHWIPAILIDGLMFIFMQKRFMLRIQQKIHNGLELLQFFTTREWIFESDNFLNIEKEMSPADKEIFPIDFEKLSIEEYMKTSILGTRQYCLKEDLSTINRCRIQQKILYVIHKTFVFAFYFGILWLLCSCSETTRNLFDSVAKYVKNVPVLGVLVPTYST